MASSSKSAPRKSAPNMIPKTLHRRIEVPVKAESAKNVQQTNMSSVSTSQQKLAKPHLNSLRRKCENLEALRTQSVNVQLKSTEELTPRSKATIAPKITQKLNFGTYQRVFKNLTPININDSILLPKQSTSIPKKYTKVANKIPAPDLCDFLDPLPPLNHQICEPELHLEFQNEPLNAFECYRRLFQLN